MLLLRLDIEKNDFKKIIKKLLRLCSIYFLYKK